LPEWLIERGIGETRAVLVEGDGIVETRVLLDGVVPAGSRVEARMVDIGTNNRNALARTTDGLEVLLPVPPPLQSEGASFVLEISREVIPGVEPWKRPLGRVSGEAVGWAWPTGRPARRGRLDAAGWNDLIEEARSGAVQFPGGSLGLYATPAMTLIDVDGHLPPDELAVLGAAAAAKAILRLGIGGPIGIDLPTPRSRSARHDAAAAVDDILPQPFQRTAVNGFGFIQIVRPRRHASLLEIAADRVAFEARALLRSASLEPPGAKRLVAHPAVTGLLQSHQDWLDALALQIGGAVSLRADPALPISGGYAEAA
jgi:ribonuclease G